MLLRRRGDGQEGASMRRVGAHAVASSVIEIGLDRSVIQAAEPAHFSR